MDDAVRKPRSAILLTGATGYVGGRLLRLLAADGKTIRAFARTPQNVYPRDQNIQIVEGDLLKYSSVESALEGVDTAYYLAHALGSSSDFENIEHRHAENFAKAAKVQQVKKIIYLGGLGDGKDLSAHLASRHRVGEILRSSGAVVVEFRASIIIGSGSLSFELVRSLTEKLPIMITPRWVRSKAQPIAIRNVLEYLLAALDHEFSESGIFEIGGPDQVPYTELMREYARQRELRRVMIPVPVLTPRLSSLWLGLVTPVYARIGRKLIESLKNDTIVTNPGADNLFGIRCMGYAEAIARAIRKEDEKLPETHWYDAISSSGNTESWGGERFGSRIVDVRSVSVALPAKAAFKPIEEIGGQRGWYSMNFMWRLRGWIDLLVGGVGMRRGRPRRSDLKPGVPLDFWRVEAFQPSKLLRLRAEMKLPGRAWLQFEATEEGEKTVITQSAIFDPLGLAGLLYWYILYPVHSLIFKNMLQNIERSAVAPQGGANSF